MSSNWPLNRIEMIDPLPYHGLVYTDPAAPAVTMIDPLDGRAPVPLPAFYDMDLSNTRLADYNAMQAGFLWDIGMPDPPASPEITAAGGTLLGRRIVGGGRFLPVRLGERTHHYFVFATRETNAATDDELLVFYAQPRSGASHKLATLALADVALDWDKMAIEYDGSLAKGQIKVPSYDATVLDISPDGTRHLFGVRLAGYAGTAGWATTMVAMLELVLSLNEEGQLQGQLSVVRTASQLLGNHSYTVSSDLSSLSSEASGPPSCTQSPIVVSDPEATSGNNGSRRQETTRSGFVIGALYAEGEIEYITASYSQVRANSISTTTDSWQYGKLVEGPDGPYCESWMPGEAPPSPDTRQTITNQFRYELNLHHRGAKVGGWINSESVENLTQRPGERPTGTSTAKDTASAGSRPEVSDVLERPFLESLDKWGPRDDEGLLYLPAALWFQNGFTISAVVARSWASFAIFESYSGPQVDEAAYWGPMVTAAGAVGATKRYRIVKTGQGSTPEFIYNAAYNPLNGQAIRECDIPGKTLVGYL